MSTIRVRVAAAVCAAAAAIAVPGVADAAPSRGPATVCAPVIATGVGQDLGNNQTTATISVGGVVVGTSTATFTPTGMTGSIVTFTGDIVISTAVGQLDAPVTGTLDVSTGRFTSTSNTVTGSGALRSVSGSLTFTGTENLSTGAFTETITGTLCSTLPRGHGSAAAASSVIHA